MLRKKKRKRKVLLLKCIQFIVGWPFREYGLSYCQKRVPLFKKNYCKLEQNLSKVYSYT